MKRLVIIFAVAGVVACGKLALSGDAGPDAARDRCTLTPSSYDQSCNTSADCVGVWFGDLCTASTCVGCEPNGAINVASTSAYEQDVAQAVDAETACPCPPPLGGPCCSHGACIFSSSGCH